jgi:hypothetical protein
MVGGVNISLTFSTYYFSGRHTGRVTKRHDGELPMVRRGTGAAHHSAPGGNHPTSTVEVGVDESLAEQAHTIAEQANLLALNALMEATQASDVSAGFAVAANQIKRLSGETGRATELIGKTLSDLNGSLE